MLDLDKESSTDGTSRIRAIRDKSTSVRERKLRNLYPFSSPRIFQLVFPLAKEREREKRNNTLSLKTEATNRVSKRGSGGLFTSIQVQCSLSLLVSGRSSSNLSNPRSPLDFSIPRAGKHSQGNFSDQKPRPR